jgi:hydroxypyruvate reductase
MTGGHPVPDAGSLEAGEALLQLASSAAPGQRVLALVSGGASSLVESLPEGITLDDLRTLNRWALGAGIDIVALNAMRRALSAIKDGRLLDHFGHCEMRGLLISDVPGDDPAVIGSGLLRRAAVQPDTSGWPEWVRELAARNPARSHTGPIPVEVVARLDDAILAAERLATSRGVPATRHLPRLDGNAEDAARRVTHELATGREGVHLWGGETTVRLPAKPGRGGRNQHLALAAAQLIAGHDEYLVLAAGTDGNDGNTDDAGALVDAGTVERGGAEGFDAGAMLLRADSATFLETSEDLVFTGPTGTNVGDLVIGLRQSATRAAQIR